ncbi:ABC transporter permease subunit [Acetomicrobium sp.]|jgi:ABC-2 type transport system permease protein|uniref:ABC transporter permease n=1 Tax=Acetomicrobium sp. TaxID=1872099 RepID=UPI001BCC5058|nr:ABC transporter permease subunit [Acetomicrobium sp.]
MGGLLPVFLKELTDQFGSKRFMLITLIIVITGLFSSYTASEALKEQQFLNEEYLFLGLFTSSGGGLPSFLFFISFFGPLLGIILGFDAINGERTRGTLSLILSQPIYRDAIINGKFLASLATVAIMIASIMVMIAGISIAKLGVVPNGQEVVRAILFFIACILYIAFWMSLAILFSIIFEKSSTSALTSIALWIFLSFFVYMIAGVVADEIYPITQQSTPELLAKHENLRTMLLRFSPAVLLEEISAALLNPTVRVFGPMFETQLKGLILTPLSLGQSVLVVWPQFVALIAASVICFAVSYLAFMRKEIRSI